jgi:hypothetical protein
MKIDITPVDLALVLTRLADYCTLLQGTEYWTKETEERIKNEVQQTKELASRLQAQRIIY